MADSEAVDTTQQVSSQKVKSQKVESQTPAKNPKRVAAGRLIAEKTRLAREAQKKALDEAKAIIANNNIQEKKAPENVETITPVKAQAANEKNADPETILTTTQWLSVISIFLSIVGIYYKREEIKSLFTPPVEPEKEVTPPVELKKGRIRSMD